MSKNIIRKLHWRKLDDQAKIYSLSRNINDTSIFRLSVILNDKINQQILEKAVELSLETYKAYKVKMEGGFFWYYLDENKKKPVVTEENDYPFQKINTPDNNDYLFKVTYFKNKINLDVFHVLTDGAGASVLLKALVYNYFILKTVKDHNIFFQDLSVGGQEIYLKDYEGNFLATYNDWARTRPKYNGLY